MDPPVGLGWEVYIGSAIAIGLALLGALWKFANWKGALDQWKNNIDDWRKSVDSRFDKLAENIHALMSDVAVIKSAQEKDATRNGMLKRKSPLVPAPKAIDILEELNILSQVDANIPYIRGEIEKRSETLIYQDIEDPEERFIAIAPSVIHELIKKGKIDEKKIDEAMKKLEGLFPVVTYYGILLLIAASMLEKRKKIWIVTQPSMVYSQIDMSASKDRDELLASFDGDPNKVIKSLEMSIRSLEQMRKKEELVISKVKLASMYKFMSRFVEAEREYREVIKIKPDYAEAHYNLGNLLADLKRYDEAEKEYREAIRIKPDYAKAHNNLGILLKESKRPEGAEKEYREAIRIKSDHAKAHYNLGNLLRDLKRNEEAEQEYLDAIRINPDFAEAHSNLGILYSQIGRLEEANKEFETAKRLFEAQKREDDMKKVDKLLKSL